MKAIDIKNLNKTFPGGEEVLKNVNLSVEEGDFFSFLGANGAGKTTLIGILTGLVNKTEGCVKVFGYNLETEMIKIKQMIGVVPQEFNFNQFEKVQDIVLTGAGYFGIPRKEAMPDVERILKMLQLWDRRNVHSRCLSGGMKRRLMLARALITKPRLLILDEPTSGVDVKLRYEMWNLLKELNKEGVTIFLTTHYLEEAEQLCRHLAIIKDGVILKECALSCLSNLVDEEIFVVQVQEVKNLERLKEYFPKTIDKRKFEVVITKKENMNIFFNQLVSAKMFLEDIRPKGNRLEGLFLKILNQKESVIQGENDEC